MGGFNRVSTEKVISSIPNLARDSNSFLDAPIESVKKHQQDYQKARNC